MSSPRSPTREGSATVYGGDPIAQEPTMTTTPMPGHAQREALEDNERKAAEEQPGTFKDEAIEDKQVEVGPDMTDAPIRGIDPDHSR